MDAAVDASPIDATVATVAVARIDAGPARQPPFPFESLRTRYDAYRRSPRHKHPCDWRDRNDWTPERRVTCPDNPGVLAAYIVRSVPHRNESVQLEINLGSDDLVNIKAGWVGAVLDKDERPITPWVPIDPFHRLFSRMTVPVPYSVIDGLDHVALHSAEDPNPRQEWPQPYP